MIYQAERWSREGKGGRGGGRKGEGRERGEERRREDN